MHSPSIQSSRKTTINLTLNCAQYLHPSFFANAKTFCYSHHHLPLPLSPQVVTEYERERILKRQYMIEKQMKINLEDLEKNIHLETGDRIEKQDTIVDEMTNFISAFQENIREEARS